MPRPDYSIPTDNFQRPSTVSGEQQATAVYRLRRLQSLVNIYHWALEWIVHSASYWTLGQEAYDFRFDQVDLWLHGIETVDDVWNLRNSIESIVAQKRDDITVVQAFGADEVQFARDVNGEVAFGVDGSHQFTAQFLSPPDATRRLQGNDWITSVTFSSPELDSDSELDRRERVPFPLISSTLRQASNLTEEMFSKLGVAWRSPPFFIGFENGAGLLVHMEAKRDPRARRNCGHSKRSHWPRCARNTRHSTLQSSTGWCGRARPQTSSPIPKLAKAGWPTAWRCR